MNSPLLSSNSFSSNDYSSSIISSYPTTKGLAGAAVTGITPTMFSIYF